MKNKTPYYSITMVMLLLFTPQFSLAADKQKENLEEKVKRLEAKIARLENLLFSVETQMKDSVYHNISKNLDDMGSRIEERIYSKISENLSAIETEVEAQVNKQFSEELATLEPAAGPENNVKIEMSPSPKLYTTDGKFEFQPFGRIHMDYTAFNDDKKNHPDNGNFRRARLGFKGKVQTDWKYKAEVDFGSESVNFKDVSLTYTGFDAVDIQAGHFKPLQSLNELTSSNYMQFIERAAPVSTFARPEIIGVAVHKSKKNWSAHLGLFNEDAGSTDTSDDEDWSVDGRATYAPVLEERKLVHIGASASFREDRDGSATFSSRGETGKGDNLITTGTISNVEDTAVYGFELAGVYGRLSAQSEFFRAEVTRNSGSADADFDGWYAQTGYFLTGESRPYNVATGTFGRIKPTSPFSLKNDSWGAWEVVGRYSNTDLNDSGAGISGGEMDIWTGGVNWYINNNVRMMADYSAIETDANAATANDEPGALTLRAQFDF